MNGLAELDDRPARRNGEGAPARRTSAAAYGRVARSATSWLARPRLWRRSTCGLAEENPKLPDDLLNFHHDPLAAAVAVGWDGVTFDGNVVSDVDGDAFSERWLQAIEHLHSGVVSDSRPVNLSASGPPETVLDAEPADARAALADALSQPEDITPRRRWSRRRRWPRYLDAWAQLGMLARDDTEAYACFRVGYHRGLDRLRANGWRGSGYVRWVHEENRGFLRSLRGLGQTADRIGEHDEAERCAHFLMQCDPDGSAGRGVGTHLCRD